MVTKKSQVIFFANYINPEVISFISYFCRSSIFRTNHVSIQMLKRLLKPADFPDGFEAWEKLPFAEKTKKICHVWAIQGFGEPNFVIGFYVLKLAFYVYIWFYFCSFSRDLGTYADVATWWFKLDALQKLFSGRF